MKNIKPKYFQSDLKAGLVVFLVALPLCLGVALTSGAPLFSGIISGVVGGFIVGFLSNSQLSVSGPAAGLTAIILAAIATLGSFEAFLVAGLLAGIMQVILGYITADGLQNLYFKDDQISISYHFNKEDMCTAYLMVFPEEGLKEAIIGLDNSFVKLNERMWREFDGQQYFVWSLDKLDNRYKIIVEKEVK